jgi:hypothetical protein
MPVARQQLARDLSPSPKVAVDNMDVGPARTRGQK